MGPQVTAGATKGTGGRRGGDADTRSDILHSAKVHFARGYSDASLRGIARDAKVDPSLVVQFFGGKDGLFLAAMADAMRPGEALPGVLSGDPAGLGRRLAGWYFGLWEDESRRQPVQALLLSAATHPAAADLLRTFVTREIVDRVSAVSRMKDRTLRTEMVGSHLIGTALARYVYRIPPLSEVPVGAVVDLVGPVINTYLLPRPARESQRPRRSG